MQYTAGNKPSTDASLLLETLDEAPHAHKNSLTTCRWMQLYVFKLKSIVKFLNPAFLPFH